MSTINESLRKLEERGAIGQASLPPGVTSATPKKVARSSNPRLMVAVLALAVLWAIWSEWDRRHPAQIATASAPLPVRVTAPPPENKPVETTEPKAVNAVAVASPVAQPVRAGAAPVLAPTPAKAPVAVERTAAPAELSAPLKSADAVQPAAAKKPPVNGPAKQLSPSQKSDAQYQQAMQLLQDGRGTDARQLLEEALELNPAHNNARQLLAALRVEDRQLGRAEMLLNEGLNYHPGPAALVALARLKAERGEDGAALQLLSDNLETGSNDAEYRAMMAALLMRQGKPDQAIAHYRAAIERQPAQGIWWAGLGLALASQKGRQTEAAQALQQARLSGKLPAALSDRVDAQLLGLMRQEDKP